MVAHYKNRIQIMVDDELLKKITKARGDIPESIFLRKKLEEKFK